MKIEDILFRGYGDITIDPAKIGSTSIHKHEIRLPYTGELPESYDTAYLFVRVAPGDARLVIVASRGKKETRYLVEATPEEINAILHPFFFKQTKSGTYTTRIDNGLSNYWTGSYQRDYVLWERYTSQPLRIVDIVRQITPEQRTELFRHLQQMEAESGKA